MERILRLIGASERHDNIPDHDHHALRPRPAEPVQLDTPHRLRSLWTQRLAIRRLVPSTLLAERNADARGIRLLLENLSQAQRDQYERWGYFEVTSGETGKRYRIRKAHVMNVQELGKRGRRMRALCFMPKGQLTIGDVMLAQKLALELFESEALAVANTDRYRPLGPLPQRPGCWWA